MGAVFIPTPSMTFPGTILETGYKLLKGNYTSADATEVVKGEWKGFVSGRCHLVSDTETPPVLPSTWMLTSRRCLFAAKSMVPSPTARLQIFTCSRNSGR